MAQKKTSRAGIMLRLASALLLVCFSLSVKAQFYGIIDRRAKTTTWEQASDQQKLIEHLTKNLTSPKDKARVIAAWIAFQMQRDAYRQYVLVDSSEHNRPAPDPLINDPFKTRIGTSLDFARLFHSLATLAGLESVVIEGFAGSNIQSFRYQKPIYQAGETLYHIWTKKNYPLQRYQAAWNAVKINNKWELLDTYYMIADTKLYEAKTIRTDFAMKSFLKRRQNNPPSIRSLTTAKKINDDYFFAKPRFFVKTHFPLDSKWQLLPIPLTWAAFVNQ